MDRGGYFVFMGFVEDGGIFMVGEGFGGGGGPILRDILIVEVLEGEPITEYRFVGENPSPGL